MTVYSGTLDRHMVRQKKAKAKSNPQWFWVNATLGFVVLILFAGQLYVSNSLVSQKVALADKKSDLYTLSAQIAGLESTIARGQDMANLLSLAHRNGMVAGKDGDTLLISSHVAISNAQNVNR